LKGWRLFTKGGKKKEGLVFEVKGEISFSTWEIQDLIYFYRQREGERGKERGVPVSKRAHQKKGVSEPLFSYLRRKKKGGKDRSASLPVEGRVLETP